MNEENKKVYCKDCRYFSWLMTAISFQRICRAEKTKKRFGYKIGVSCEEKNQDFDCKDYKEKWYKSE